ncbi:hypothetical protein M3231_03310 [Neobacillus mesonae]|nr:hypothetical protein [Neobacillus mesonae]
MGIKEEFKREMQNAMKDVEKEVHRTWKVDYKGHSIEVHHQLKEEQLIIDGFTVDKKQRKYIFSHIKPFSKLSGTLTTSDGLKQKVTVKLGGFINFNCVIKIDNATLLNDSLQLNFLPWEHKKAIVPYLQEQVKTHGMIIDDYLPDDQYLYDENHPRMAAGYADYGVVEMPNPLHTKKLIERFEQQLKDPTNKTRKATYEQITFDHMASSVSEFMNRLEQAELDEALVEQEAVWLLEHAAHREVVKFAILVLGSIHGEKYKDLLFTIGLHSEFTSYVIMSLKQGTREPNQTIFQLAKSVQGYGKVAAIEQLEATTPEMKYWLLTNGCEGSLADYLSYTCAVKGELAIALYQEEISKELYDGAGRIIVSLLGEAMDHDINDYLFETATLFRFVSHARNHCQLLKDFYPLMTIDEYLNSEEIWEDQSDDEWKQQERLSIQQAILPVSNDPKWPQLAIEAIEKRIDAEAIEIARYYKLDIRSKLFELLKVNPTNQDLYRAVMQSNHRQDIIDLCVFAEHYVIHSELSTEQEDCLRCIVQDLYDYEGIGLPLVQTALESDKGDLQYLALSVLDYWTPSVWQQQGVLDAVQNISNTSKDKEDRKLAKQLLSKH